ARPGRELLPRLGVVVGDVAAEARALERRALQLGEIPVVVDDQDRRPLRARRSGRAGAARHAGSSSRSRRRLSTSAPRAEAPPGTGPSERTEEIRPTDSKRALDHVTPSCLSSGMAPTTSPSPARAVRAPSVSGVRGARAAILAVAAGLAAAALAGCSDASSGTNLRV